MPVSIQQLKDELLKIDIRPTYQRIRILEYLYKKGGHPTAEEIFAGLLAEIPALSKTTVYNTLHTFAEAGLLWIIKIDNDETRFDVTLNNHGHFQCLACGSLTNFPIDIEEIRVAELSEFEIREKNVYFRGLCPNCLILPMDVKE